MQITLYWWYLPIAIVLFAWGAADIYVRINYKGNYDFFTMIVAISLFTIGVAIALGVLIGKLI